MYVGLKQPRGDGERFVTPARAAAKETKWLREIEEHERKSDTSEKQSVEMSSLKPF